MTDSTLPPEVEAALQDAVEEVMRGPAILVDPANMWPSRRDHNEKILRRLRPVLLAYGQRCREEEREECAKIADRNLKTIPTKSAAYSEVHYIAAAPGETGEDGMSWNYRIVRDNTDGSLAIHEVYYNEDGQATTMTVNPAVVISEEVTGIADVLLMMRSACRRPVLRFLDGVLSEESLP